MVNFLQLVSFFPFNQLKIILINYNLIMEQMTKYAVLGDIGGTNFRLRILNLTDKTTFLQKTYSATDDSKLKSYIDKIL